MPDTWAVASNAFHLSMDFNCKGGGWSERHCLGVTTPSTAIANAQLMIQWRLAILPQVDNLIYAKVNIPGGPRDSIMIPMTFPAPGQWILTTAGTPPVVTPGSDRPNDDDDCLVYRKQTTWGYFTTHFIHGIPDAEISGDVLTGGFPTIPAAPPATVPAPAPGGWTTALGAYLSSLVQETVIVRVDTGGGTGPPVLMSSSIAAVVPRKVTTKKIGIPFGQEHGRHTIH